MAMKSSSTVGGQPSEGPRWDLAKWVALFAFLTTGVLGLSAIAAAVFAEESKFDSVKDVLSILLPVIGAWMGTVLAYFFAKENFQAATDGQARLMELSADDRLQSIRVRDKGAMIARSEMTVMSLGAKPASAVLLQQDCRDLLVRQKRNRLPVFDANDAPKYIVHRSLIDDYIVKTLAANATHPPTVAAMTLADLVADPAIGPVVSTIVTVGENATLADARAKMEALPQCTDVFVTSDGTPNGRVIGWVTNHILTTQGRLT